MSKISSAFKWKWVGSVAALGMILAAVILLPAPAPVVGAETAPPYQGLDLVILADQSGSMGGLEYGSTDHPRVNDTNKLRFIVGQSIMDWLGRARLTYGKERNMDFRVALVDWGDTVEVRLPPITIAPQSDEDWNPKLNQLTQQLSADRFGKRNLGNTNPLLAFQQAKALFDQMDAQGGGRRLHVIMLLTDGLPYVLRQPPAGQPTPTSLPPGAPAPTPTREQSIPLDEYMRELIAYAGQSFPAPDYQIFVVGMNDSDRDQWGPAAYYWRQLTNDNAKLTEDNQQAGALMQEYWGQVSEKLGLIGGRLIPCGQYAVSPYLQSIAFTFHKALASDQVQIRVKNVPLNLDNPPRVTVSGPGSVIETVQVHNPDPGYWDLICSAGGKLDPKIYVEEVTVETQIQQPRGIAFQHLPTQIELKLSGYGGSDLPRYDDPRYQLNVEAGIIRPSGTVSVPLRLGNQGLYTAPFTPEEIGNYQVRVAATTLDPNGKSFRLPLRQDTASFVVSATKPKLLASPPPTTVLVPSRVTLEFVNDMGGRIPPEVFTKLASQILLILDEPAGPRTFPLQPQTDGTLAASVTPLQAGELPIRLSTSGGGRQVEEQLGILSVRPLRVEMVGLADAQAQYKSTNLVLRLLDQDGKPLMASADKTVNLEIGATLSGADTAALTLAPGDNSTWAATIRPQGAGQVNVRATIKTAGAPERILFDSDVGAFQVTPTTMVSVIILQPKNGAELEYNKPIPFWLNPLEFEIELQGNGQRLDPTQVLADSGRLPFVATLVEGQGRDRTAEVTIEPSGQPGLWRGHSESISGRGVYQLRVIGNAALKPAFVWDETPRSVSFTRVPNRWLPFVYALCVLLAAIALFMAGREFANRFVLAKARGVLSLVDSGSRSIGTSCDLTSRGLHRVAWNPGAPQSGVRSIQVTGLRNGVRVRVNYVKGGGVTYDLTGVSRRSLTGGYWIAYQGVGGGPQKPQINW